MISGKILKTVKAISHVDARGIGLRPIPEAVRAGLMFLLCSFTLVRVFFLSSFLVLKCFTASYKIIQAAFKAKVLIGMFLAYSHFTHMEN